MAIHLIPLETVRRRMFLPDQDGVRRAILETLEGTTQQLETEMRTRFDFESGLVDLFYVDDSSLRGARFAERFLLGRGLVDETANAVKVEVASRNLDFLPGGDGDPIDLRDTTETQVDDPDQFVRVEARRGVVTIHDFRLLRQYVQVTYDAGIDQDPNKSTLFLQADSTVDMAGGPDLTFDDVGTITRSAGDWQADGFRANDRVRATGTVSNNSTFLVTGVATTVLTVTGTLVDEASVSGAAVTASRVGVPAFIKELATLWTMLELVSSPQVGIEELATVAAKAVRPATLERKIEGLLDEHTRYQPDANKILDL